MYINRPIAWIVGLFSLMTNMCLCSIYSYTQCSSVQILNSKTLSCQECVINKHPNPNQTVSTQCVCKKGFYATDNDACNQYFPGSSSPNTSTGACASDKFINAFSLNGTKVASVTGCTSCNDTAYQNSNGTGCIPCPTGMKYNSTISKCQCIINSSYGQTALGCFPQSYTSGLGLTLTSSTYYTKLKYLVPACYYFKSPLACSQLVNLCMYSTMQSGFPECDFFTKANLTSYMYSDTVNVYKNTITDKTKAITMKLVSFLPQGNYLGEKIFILSDLARCGMPSSTPNLMIGSNVQVSCIFDFNNLVGQMQGAAYQSYVYQLLIQGQNSVYYEVNTYLNGASQAVKRFFLEDTTTSSTNINVATSITFQLTLNSDGSLVSPSLYIAYKSLSLQVGTGVTPVSAQQQSLTYIVQFTSDLTGFWSVILPIFIVVNVLIIVHAAIKTYIGYLNRKTLFLFFLNWADIWSLWIFYLLLIATGYWFIFTKTTSTIYTFISSSGSLYVAFYIVFSLMVAFRIICSLMEKFQKLKIQIFMINWEKERTQNSWREIFVINSLAEFCTYRTFSVFWIMLIMLFFVTGLSWEDHSRQVITTDINNISYLNRKNQIFMYFLSSSILLVIIIVFKILRRLLVLFWPYPFEDFVDYCSVTNISFFFMKKRSPEAFYIHAKISDKTEVTYKQINQAVRRGLRKQRSITNQVNSDKNLKLYTVYVNRDIQDKLMGLLKKQQDHSHNRNTKYAIKSTISIKPIAEVEKDTFRPRRQFIQKKLKPALQQMVGSQMQQTNVKSFIESFTHVPPIDLRNEKGLNTSMVYSDQKFELARQVFPNGDQFEELHTIIIIYLMWIMITGSSPIAAFLTYFCDQWIINAWIGSSYKKHLQKMTKVKEGFML